MQNRVTKFVISVIGLCIVAGIWFVYSGIYKTQAQTKKDSLTFEVKEGETAAALAERLEKDHVIGSASLFTWYVKIKGVDTAIHQGTFSIQPPFTIARIVQKLQNPSENEISLKIIPGWDLRRIAEEFEKLGIAKKEDVYKVVGEPAVDYRTRKDKPTLETNFPVVRDKPAYVSFEGYIRPDTYRFFKDATVEDIFKRLIKERDRQLLGALNELTGKTKVRTIHEVMTMASILEREVQKDDDKKMVSDIFWKRHDAGMGLQADSTVHYASGRTGDVFTTDAERDADSLWNTYKYPGLPLGPISTPSLESIDAAANPTPNDYWYFLTDKDGKVRYAKTLEEHNANVQKYLR